MLAQAMIMRHAFTGIARAPCEEFQLVLFSLVHALD